MRERIEHTEHRRDTPTTALAAHDRTDTRFGERRHGSAAQDGDAPEHSGSDGGESGRHSRG